MELKNFVKEVLLEITEAVYEAKKESKVPIAPTLHLNKDGSEKPLDEKQDIEFDIGLTAKDSTSESSKKGLGLAISVVKAQVGGSNKKTSETNYDHRIKFSVPVYFQKVWNRNNDDQPT